MAINGQHDGLCSDGTIAYVVCGGNKTAKN